MHRIRLLFPILFCLVALIPSAARAKTAFAVLPAQPTGKATADDAAAFTNAFVSALVRSRRYELVDRKKLEAILAEQALHLSGTVDPSQVVSVGKLAAADKLIGLTLSAAAPGTARGTDRTYTINVYNVETGRIEFTDSDSDSLAIPALAKNSVAKLMDRYGLLGKVTAATGGGLVIDLGENDGLKNGRRIFIARKESLRDGSGKVVFEETKRVGVARVRKLNPGSAFVVPFSLEKGMSAATGDLVSPEPLPREEPRIARSPQLPNVEPGKLLLEDDMEDNQYLAVEGGPGNAYRDDKVFLDASGVKRGHAYTFYGAPIAELDDFIFEGDIAFEQCTPGWGAAHLVFRSNREYSGATGYVLWFTNDGNFDISYLRNGMGINVVKSESSALLAKRGDDEARRFRIVAVGSRYDIYVDDEFLVGFEHELLEGGGIGLWAMQRTCLSLDDVMVREAKTPAP